MKLTELIPPGADAFLAGKLTVGHALLVAKLPPAQQAEALKAAIKPTWASGGQTEALIPVKELAGWIESNILLDLQTAPFDRADASLSPEAGICHECPKRTGANILLFPESDRDQCLDRGCYQMKVSAHIATALQGQPQLVQISTSWGAHNNGVLARNQYVEIAAKSSRNGHGKPAPERKKCAHMTQAIVVEGGNCGHVVNVCADPACETHHAESRKNREAQERMRTEQPKQVERRKEDLETRGRVLTAVLEKIAAPLSKSDLELVPREFLNHLPNEYRTLLSERRARRRESERRRRRTVRPSRI